jgi:hypothetical protein
MSMKKYFYEQFSKNIFFFILIDSGIIIFRF